MIRKIAKRKRMQCKWARKLSLHMLTVGGFVVSAAMMQSCDKDILTGQPEWLGNSIYERLEEGIQVDGQTKSFKTTLRLIDDLDYKETLSKTGSKTLFVASDDAYQAWFNSNNIFGVRSYEELTKDQKRQLFNGTMINNAYLLELMSNVPSTADDKLPESGMCMRRETAASSLDNIPVVKVEDFPINTQIPSDPVNRAWGSVRNQGKDIHLLKDWTSPPMIHFLPQFMEKNNITDNDLYVISNHRSESIQDSWVNGKKVISKEQTCKNGYIYVIDGVMESTPNMAEIIRTNSNTKLWAKMLYRYSYPSPMDREWHENFWRLHPECENDTLYTLTFLNYSGNAGAYSPTGSADDNLNASGLLKFDLTWNKYEADNAGIIMQNDAAAIFVPNDKVLTEWFENGSGKVLKDKFGTWDNIPYETLAKLLNVNMQESFVASVPSKFHSILDDSQRSMGITIADIDSCVMGCNGVVYITNKVFAPAEYSSVMFPALIQSSSDYSVIYHALTSNYNQTYVQNYGAAKDFTPYLTAMDSKFSLIIPFNNETWYKINNAPDIKTISFIDPCSYGLPQQFLLVFYYYKEQINGMAVPVVMNSDGSWKTADGPTYPLTSDVVVNRLYDYLDNSILIEEITSDKTMYKTKAGSVIKAFKEGNDMCFQGGLQLHTGKKVKATSKYIYNMGSEGNGTTYGVNDAESFEQGKVHIPMTSAKSVYNILKEERDKGGDSLFYNMIYADESGKGALFATRDGKYYCLNPAENKNLNVFDNYNYTVYVPTDAAIRQMINNGWLPTWDDYNKSNSDDEKKVIAERIHNFVRYHIQDNSVYIGGDKVSNFQYESGKLNPENKRFYTISVTQDGNSLTVKDQLGKTYTANVTASNKCCREYWVEWGSGVKLDNLSNSSYKNNIVASSNAVIHKINGVLLYDKSQETKWK